MYPDPDMEAFLNSDFGKKFVSRMKGKKKKDESVEWLVFFLLVIVLLAVLSI